MRDSEYRHLGAVYLDRGTTEFCVWAPKARRVDLEVLSEQKLVVRMSREGDGYHVATLDKVAPGTRYWYLLDGRRRRADPASRYQPEGVGGPSEVIDPSFRWRDDAWQGLPIEQYIIYELHVGCFSAAGDFAGVVRRLDTLRRLGITAVEIMPVAQFPGTRNWGYDGVFPFAVQNSYGGPAGLQRLVDACHRRGMAVVLDVVHNHLGPEGNEFAGFGPYFSDRYHTPWGAAINFDGPGSDHVRRYFIENAVYWIRDFHIDALRLDAIQMIFDTSARPILRELTNAVHAEGRRQGRRVHVIGETSQNDVRQVADSRRGGLGLDAVWNEDFHSSVHALLTRETIGKYQDFGRMDDVVKALQDGFVLDGRYSRYRRRRHGSSSRSLPGKRLVVYLQNHDLAGNRLYGERLGHLVSWEQRKLAAAMLFLSPYVPLLFMGEEYGEDAPFLYFINHQSQRLVARVRKGRIRDCRHFLRDEPVPDPGHEQTCLRSKLNHALRSRGQHRVLWEYYRELIRLRKWLFYPPATNTKDRPKVDRLADSHVLLWRRSSRRGQVIAALNLGEAATVSVKIPRGRCTRLLDSADERWRGPGTAASTEFTSNGHVRLDLAAHSAVLFMQRGGEK